MIKLKEEMAPIYKIQHKIQSVFCLKQHMHNMSVLISILETLFFYKPVNKRKRFIYKENNSGYKFKNKNISMP